MVRLAKHKQPTPKLQLWQHKANIKANIRQARLLIDNAKAELIDAWHTLKTN
jgi:hypothetical protein